MVALNIWKDVWQGCWRIWSRIIEGNRSVHFVVMHLTQLVQIMHCTGLNTTLMMHSPPIEHYIALSVVLYYKPTVLNKCVAFHWVLHCIPMHCWSTVHCTIFLHYIARLLQHNATQCDDALATILLHCTRLTLLQSWNAMNKNMLFWCCGHAMHCLRL